MNAKTLNPSAKWSRDPNLTPIEVSTQITDAPVPALEPKPDSGSRTQTRNGSEYKQILELDPK